jgi:hypothetical protein
MRGVLLSLMLATMVVLVAPGGGSAPGGSTLIGPVLITAELQAQTPPSLDIDVDVNRGGDGAWYRNPIWIAIAVIGGALLLLLIVLAIRGGGGTTIVEK